MGKRLPPGEAERRAAERQRATWSGERYARYDPLTEGYGSFKSWADAAAAFIHGDLEGNYFEWAEGTEEIVKPVGPKRRVDSHLERLGLDDPPADLKALISAYRRCVMKAFQLSGSSDTDPRYVASFREITLSFDHLKLARAWK